MSALRSDSNTVTGEPAPPVVGAPADPLHMLFFCVIFYACVSVCGLILQLVYGTALQFLPWTMRSICCSQMPLSSEASSHQYVRSIVLGGIECVREKNFT